VEAVIVDAVRTPVGRRNGRLSAVHPIDLAAGALEALVRRSDLDPAEVDDVILGCFDQVDQQGANVARLAALAAGFPETVPGVTVDRQCGSSQQAVHFAAQGVMAGAYDVVIAGGVESMSLVPFWSNIREPGRAYGRRFRARYGLAEDEFINQGLSAEMVADRFELERGEMDELSVESHRRAARAAAEGRFDAEIVPVALNGGDSWLTADEGVRPKTSIEALARLKPAFRADGRVTAGNASQISDGAAALLVMSEERAARLNLRPRARFAGFALAGGDPIEMLTATIPATRKVLERAGMTLDDMDLVEVNEAFASVVLAWARALDADLGRTNVNGGAIALGHPLGCSGARIMATLVNEMERSGARFGLQTMCEGGGMANATILERLA
jgi:acetyl-CoA acetyltransferase family protein